MAPRPPHPPNPPDVSNAPVRPLRAATYASLEPWLVQEEKLSYSESLREPAGSAAGLPEKLEEEEEEGGGPSALPGPV